MNWPNPGDYQDAIQNPKHVFRDPELQAGSPVMGKLGLPRVASGNFASVYEVRSGSRRWAVRCFLRRVSDQKDRYALLSQYLSNLSLPCLVDFEFQDQGILVNGQRYPIVKMEWVDGVALHTYVERHLNDPKALRDLAARWHILVKRLHGNGMAHGDLQHGNVMVTSQGRIRLVDYDAMFIPVLQGEPSHESGHVNYQHPGRSSSHFDATIDNFSALTIFTSLRALAVDPDLLSHFSSGENLILAAADYHDPHHSPVFEALRKSTDPDVRTLAKRLAGCCRHQFDQIPTLESIIATLAIPQVAIPPKSVSAPRPKSPATPVAAQPTWLKERMSGHTVGAASPSPTPPNGGPAVRVIPQAVPRPAPVASHTVPRPAPVASQIPVLTRKKISGIPWMLAGLLIAIFAGANILGSLPPHDNIRGHASTDGAGIDPPTAVASGQVVASNAIPTIITGQAGTTANVVDLLPAVSSNDLAIPKPVSAVISDNRKVNPKDRAALVMIPAGSFRMGDWDQKDNPRHTVRMSAYLIYKNLVTVGQYKQYAAAMRAAGQEISLPEAPEFNPNWIHQNHPIVNVSWQEAKAYCTWAGGDLPTEAQWEKAARGANGLRYPWGDSFDRTKPWGDKTEGTTAVGRYGVSSYRCTDMAGNVWQWCQDMYDADYWSQQPDNNLDPVNETGSDQPGRVLRGGSWLDNGEEEFRSSRRFWHEPTRAGNIIGFRCVLPPEYH